MPRIEFYALSSRAVDETCTALGDFLPCPTDSIDPEMVRIDTGVSSERVIFKDFKVAPSSSVMQLACKNPLDKTTTLETEAEAFHYVKTKIQGHGRVLSPDQRNEERALYDHDLQNNLADQSSLDAVKLIKTLRVYPIPGQHDNTGSPSSTHSPNCAQLHGPPLNVGHSRGEAFISTDKVENVASSTCNTVVNDHGPRSSGQDGRGRHILMNLGEKEDRKFYGLDMAPNFDHGDQRSMIWMGHSNVKIAELNQVGKLSKPANTSFEKEYEDSNFRTYLLTASLYFALVMVRHLPQAIELI